MKKAYLELIVGLFLALGIGGLGYLSINIARNKIHVTGGYEIHAVFSNATGLREGTPILIAGVEVGCVKSITLDDYQAKVLMLIQRRVVLQQDAIASIKTQGLIGEKYIQITPGASEARIAPGGNLRDTEPAMDLEEMISKYVQGSLANPEKKN